MSTMLELDPRLVIVGGLIIIALFWQAPLYTILIAILSGGVVHARQQYKRGWRVVLGLNGLQFYRQTRQTRLRSPSSPILSQKSTLNLSTPKNDKLLSPPRPWGQNTTVLSTPVLRPGYFINCQRNTSAAFLRRQSTSVTSPNSRTSQNYTIKSPSTLQDASKIGSRNKVDSTLSKSDVSYSPVCDEKYVGVGVYPTVNLNPYPPLLLTCVNTSMTKNRVTVKIAPPDRGTNLKVRCNSQYGENPECHDAQSTACLGADALKGARKRPIRDNINEKKSTQKKAKVDISSSLPFKYINPDTNPMPNGFSCRFGTPMDDDSLKILPPSFETDQAIRVKLCNQPTVVRRAQTNAILSSYSSSQRMIGKEGFKIIKRKMDQSALDGPSRTGKKPAHSPPIGEIQELESIAGTTVLNSAGTDEICMKKPPDGSQEVATTDIPTSKTPVSTPPKSLNSDSKTSPREVIMAPNKGQMPMHIPRYIPSLNDYLEDKKVNQQRLQKMLNSISSGNEKDKEESKETPKLQANQTSPNPVCSSSSELNSATVVTNVILGNTSANVIDGTSSKDVSLEKDKPTPDISSPSLSFVSKVDSNPPTQTVSSMSESNDDKLPTTTTQVASAPTLTLTPSSSTSPSFPFNVNTSFTGSYGQICSYSGTSNTVTVVTSPSNLSVGGVARPLSSPFAGFTVSTVKSISSSSPQTFSLVTTSSPIANSDKNRPSEVITSKSSSSGNAAAEAPAAAASFANFSSPIQSPPDFSKGFTFGTSANALSTLSSPVACSSAMSVAQSPPVMSTAASLQSSSVNSTSTTFFTSPFNPTTPFSNTVSAPPTFSTGKPPLVPPIAPGTGSTNLTFSSITGTNPLLSSSVTTTTTTAAAAAALPPPPPHAFAPSSNSLNSTKSSSPFGVPSVSSQQMPSTGTSSQLLFRTSKGSAANGNNFAAASSGASQTTVFQNSNGTSLFTNSSGMSPMTGSNVSSSSSSNVLPAFNNLPSVKFGSANSAQTSNANTLGGFAFGSTNSSNINYSMPSLSNVTTSVINSTPSFGLAANNSSSSKSNNNNNNDNKPLPPIFSFGAKSPPLGAAAFGTSSTPGTVTSPNPMNINNNNSSSFPPKTNTLPAFGNSPVVPAGGFSFGGAAPSSSFASSTGMSKPNSEFQFNSPTFSNPAISSTFPSPLSHASNSCNTNNLFTFGAANASTSSQGFQFNPSSKASFNFAPSGPSTSGGNEPPMFSIGSGSTSARRSKFNSKTRSNR